MLFIPLLKTFTSTLQSLAAVTTGCSCLTAVSDESNSAFALEFRSFGINLSYDLQPTALSSLLFLAGPDSFADLVCNQAVTAAELFDIG
jgi:hypothetical protein